MLSMLVPIILGAVGYLLIQHGVVKSQATFAGGLVAIVAALLFALAFTPGTFESTILMLFCAMATGGGIGFLTAREPVYAALGFATAVLSISGVMFMQSALFIAAATMIVYAGATIIIFLFVLMFAQQTDLRNYDVQMNSPILAAVIGAIFLATITICVTSSDAMLPIRSDTTRSMSAAAYRPAAAADPSSVNAATTPLVTEEGEAAQQFVPSTTSGLGRSLYTDYLLSVELAGAVLLVATIGAIALAQRPIETQKGTPA